MNEQLGWGSLIVSGIAALIVGLGPFLTWLKGRGENRNRAAEVESTAEVQAAEIAAAVRRDEFQNNLALANLIREQVKEQVEERIGEFKQEIKDLRSEVTSLQANERKRTQAMTRILRAIANQWPNGSGPDLDPADIQTIEEAIPPQWIRPARGPRRAPA